MKLLKLDDLVAIHVLILHETGGGEGLRDIGPLESATAAQRQEVFGEVLYPSIYAKAAAIIRSIIGGHPFVDGNKRTAMLAGLTLLRYNGYQTSLKAGELEDFAVQVAVEHLSVEQIAEWLDKHSAKRTGERTGEHTPQAN